MMSRLLSLFFLLAASSVHGQTPFYDFLYNEVYNVQTKSIVAEPSGKWIREKIYVSYPEIQGAAPLNARIKKVCESFFGPMQKQWQSEAELRLLNYIDAQSSKRSYRNQTNPIISLSEAGVRIRSIVGHQVWYEIIFTFDIIESGSRNKESLDVYYYYVGDFSSGVVHPWQLPIDASKKRLLEDMLGWPLQQAYLEMLAQEQDKHPMQSTSLGIDNYLKNENETAQLPNLGKQIDFAKADFFPEYSGLMVQLQPYCNASNPFQDRFVKIFIPYDAAREIMSVFPQFGPVRRSPQVSTHRKDWSEEEWTRKISHLRHEPMAEDWLSSVGPNAVSVELKRSQIMSDGRLSPMAHVVYKMREDGQLESIETKSDGNTAEQTLFEYGSSGKMHLQRRIQAGQTRAVTRYAYDSRGNTVSKQSISPGSDTESVYYFHNGSVVYRFVHNAFTATRQGYIRRYDEQPHGLGVDDALYHTDASGRIKAFTGGRYPHSRGQIGRDASGRIIEGHFDNERDHFYFEYDHLGRLSQMRAYDHATLKKDVQLTYEQQHLYPVRIETARFNYGQVTRVVEEFTWNFSR